MKRAAEPCDLFFQLDRSHVEDAEVELNRVAAPELVAELKRSQLAAGAL